jgi:hypothetical protein
MKKIYYLKQEVKIGDIIDIDGFKVQITTKVIDENPDKFVLKERLSHKQQTTLNEKTLEDYENELLHDDESGAIVCGIEIKNSLFYAMMKFMQPRLYWLKVLQLIADDLNDGWEPNWSIDDYNKTYIMLDTKDNIYSTPQSAFYHMGVIYFKSVTLAKKAIELMGDNLKYIYGNA